MTSSPVPGGRQVVLGGGSPWGFRMHGGSDSGQPLRISRVNPGSKAAEEAIREGEIITAINGQSTDGLPNSEAHALMRTAGDTLVLTLSQDPSKRRLHNPGGAPPRSSSSSGADARQTESSPDSAKVEEVPEVEAESADKTTVPQSSHSVQQQQQQKSSPSKTINKPQPPQPASHEPTKSVSHRAGGRQKRSRRLRARKIQQQLSDLLQTSEDEQLDETPWEEVGVASLAPLPAPVHASPLVYAEAAVVVAAAPRTEAHSDDDIRRLFEIHLTTKLKMMKRKAETFPPSLRRLDVIKEDEEIHSHHADHNIYEDIDLRGSELNLSLSDSGSDCRLSEVDEATLEFEKIMNAEELNYEPYHSSSSDLDADFACDDLVSELLVRRGHEVARVVTDDYETVVVAHHPQPQQLVVVQEVNVRECLDSGDFNEMCRQDGVASDDDLDEEFEQICNEQSDEADLQTQMDLFENEILEDNFDQAMANLERVSDAEVESIFRQDASVKTYHREALILEDNLYELKLDNQPTPDNFTEVDFAQIEPDQEEILVQEETISTEREVTESPSEKFTRVQIDFEKSKPLPISSTKMSREEEIKLAKLNFLKTPMEDQSVTTEIFYLPSPRLTTRLPSEPPPPTPSEEEPISKSPFETLELHSNEIISKFSSKLEEVNEFVYERSSPVIMEQINVFARRLIGDEERIGADEAGQKSLFEANKDKLVSYIREMSSAEEEEQEDAQPPPPVVDDVPNLLKILRAEPPMAEEERTLTSLEAVTRRLAEVLSSSLQRREEEEPEAESTGWSGDDRADISELSSSLALSPLSPTRSHSHSPDSNTSQGTTVFVASTCSSACSSGWRRQEAAGAVTPPPRGVTSLRRLCVAAVARLTGGRALMLDWGLATPAELKIQRPDLESASSPAPPVPPPPSARWYPTGVGPYAVGLSPAQQRALPQLSRQRAALLLDLHCKFAQRRAYHERQPSHAMGVDQQQQPQDGGADVDAEALRAKMLADWLEDEVKIDETHTQSVMTTARKFEVARYHISKQRDIAVEIQGQQQFRKLKEQVEQQMLEAEQRHAEEQRQQQMAPDDDGASSPGQQLVPDQLERLVEDFASATRARMAEPARPDAATMPSLDFGNNNYSTPSATTTATSTPSTVPTPTFKAKAPSPGVWSPKPGRAASSHPLSPTTLASPTSSYNDEPPPAPVWTPKASPTLERKEFRPVRFEAATPPPRPPTYQEEVAPPFDLVPAQTREQATTNISSSLDRKLTLNIPKLPRAQNPTVTLLQKAREGQLPKGAIYLDHKMSEKESQHHQHHQHHQEQLELSPPILEPHDIVYSVKSEECSGDKKTVQLSPKKYDGIGPTTKDGVPIVLRSGIKEENYGKWYKRMYDSLHKAGRDDDHITIRYRPSSRRGQSGYASEPEPSAAYDSDVASGYSAKYATLDRRRIKNKESDFTSTTMPRSRGLAPSIKYACEVYKNQPGRIEDYEPGRSSISEKEAKLWWDEVMEIFDGQSGMQASALSKKLHGSSLSHATENPSAAKKLYMANALKDGYDSDSQLVFKKRVDSESALSPVEQKQAYKSIQLGGEVPMHGLRKAAPEKPKDAIEFFPLSPTLTRIRVHKPVPSLLLYPAARTTAPVFATFKRTARFAAPLPPLRRSSRHNTTLRLWSAAPPPTRLSLLRERLLRRLPAGTTTRSATVLLTKEAQPVRLSVSVSPRGRQLLNTTQTAPLRRPSASSVRHAECVSPKKKALKPSAPAPSSLAKPKTKEEPKKKSKEPKTKSNGTKKANGNGKKASKVTVKKSEIPKRVVEVRQTKPQARLSRAPSVLEKARRFSHTVRTQKPSTESSTRIFLTQRRAVSQSPFRLYDALLHASAPCLAMQPRSSSAPPLLDPGNRRPKSPLSRAEYIEHLLELKHKVPTGERFKELTKLFGTLERAAHLQKMTASCGDVRKAVIKQPRLANFERWWCERTLAKAERELRQIHNELRHFGFGPLPLATPPWRPDSGLRCKQLSVDDLRCKFLSIAANDGTTDLQVAKLEELEAAKDSYKPLWRGSSVQNLAEHFVTEKRRAKSAGACTRSSSLSKHEVATLKRRLSDILRQPPKGAAAAGASCEVRVGRPVAAAAQGGLHVRRNSLLTREQLYSPVVKRREARRSASMKADSLAALPTASSGASTLTESDKRRISMTLSQEILARVGKKKQQQQPAAEKRRSVVAASKSTSSALPVPVKKDDKPRGAAVVPKAPPPPVPVAASMSPSVSPRTCYSLDSNSTCKNEFVLVLAPEEAPRPSAVAEWAESGGGSSAASEASSKATVVARAASAASSSLPESRSCTDLKDYFGERAATPTSMLRARSTSPDVRALADRFERRRSPSPIPPRKIRDRDRFVSRLNVISKTAALQMRAAASEGHGGGGGSLHRRRSRSGDVHRLCQQFENASLLGQMFTSAPDVRELNTVAPLYFSKPILKSAKDKQQQQSKPKYDPEVHKPKFTYRPAEDGRHHTAPPRNVKFKEPDVLQSFFEEFERDKESPHKFVEGGDVTIHYKSPVRGLAREAPLSEEELARRQEEAMRRIYQEERRRKYLQELHDIESRRHTDNFTPSQKSPIPLNRYDDFFEDIPSRRDRTPEPKMVARALYNFVGQSPRELTFRRGDIILVRRQIDKNWYEGEHNASIGLFPFNYVEIIPYDGGRSTMPKVLSEGKARAKFNFVAQSSLELSLVKGEMVVLTRRVDDNWYEGRIGLRRGIFPCSYVEVINEPGERLDAQKPTPKFSGTYLNGSSTPASHSHSTYSGNRYTPFVNQTLHIDTRSDPMPYRSLYNYKPQNDDELELHEGDTVFVMEKCDDGWYVGTSSRTGHFGTFPGNYVERI